MKKLLIILSLLLTTSVFAKTYKITLLATPGSGSDVVVRMIADALEKETKHTFVVINRTGAFGLVNYKSFLTENQNNDTICMLGGTSFTIPEISNYNKESKPLITLYGMKFLVVARKDSNIKTPKDIKGKLNIGFSNLLSKALFEDRFVGDFQLVDYKSENEALVSLLYKQVDLASVSTQNTMLNSMKDKFVVMTPFNKNIVNPAQLIVGKTMDEDEILMLSNAFNVVLKKPEIINFMQTNFNTTPEGGSPEKSKMLLENYLKLVSPLIKNEKN